jgi:hypothetical protein
MPRPIAAVVDTLAEALKTPTPGDPIAALEVRIARLELLLWVVLLSGGDVAGKLWALLFGGASV